MAISVFALLSLCLAFSAYGIPIEVQIAPSKPSIEADESDSNGINPQLLGGGFEGDMIFPDGFDPTDESRGVAIYGNRQWPNRVIPYDISAINNAQNRKTITDAMNALMYAVGTPVANSPNRNSCVYFRPRQSGDTSYFKIQYGNGCSAGVGYAANRATAMTLQQNGCFSSKIIQHELLHILGFYHEQSRPDRDNFLTVNLENVPSNMRHNFNKYAWGSSVLNQGTRYDYSSIMHYETTAFSMNGRPTMVPRQSGVATGKAQVLSATDIVEVRKFYGCTP